MQPDTSLYNEDGSLEVCLLSHCNLKKLEHRCGSCSCLLAKHQSSDKRKTLLLQVEYSSLLDVRSSEVATKPEQAKQLRI